MSRRSGPSNRNIRSAIEDRKFQEDVEQDESLNFLLRNTVSLTMLAVRADQRDPPRTWANLDVRLLPEKTRSNFWSVRRIVTIPMSRSNRKQRSSGSRHTRLPTPRSTMRSGRVGQYFPGSPVVPRLTSGYPRTSATGPWGSRPTDSLPTRQPTPRAAPNTA